MVIRAAKLENLRGKIQDKFRQWDQGPGSVSPSKCSEIQGREKLGETWESEMSVDVETFGPAEGQPLGT